MNSATNALAFGQYANAYAQHRPAYPAALWQWIAAQCPAHENAWDAGCGNGQASTALAQHFAHVLATDISAEQISAATVHDRVTYHAVSAEDARLAPASLDLVCAAQALHWFDLAAFWPKVHSALKPGGAFLAVGYGIFTVDAHIDALSEKYFLNVVQPFQSAANKALGEGYKDIAFPFKMLAPPPLAIEMHWTVDQLLSYAGTWSAVARMRKESGIDPMVAYRDALVYAWRDLPRTVRMPLTIKAGLNQ